MTRTRIGPQRLDCVADGDVDGIVLVQRANHVELGLALHGANQVEHNRLLDQHLHRLKHVTERRIKIEIIVSDADKWKANYTPYMHAPVDGRELLFPLCVRVDLAINNLHLLKDCAFARLAGTQQQQLDLFRLLAGLVGKIILERLVLLFHRALLRSVRAAAPHLDELIREDGWLKEGN